MFGSVWAQSPSSIYDFEVEDMQGNTVPMSRYKGKVLVVVNVANECKLVPQYEDLQALYEDYSAEGLVVLVFPTDNYTERKPYTDTLSSACTQRYGITFPILGNLSVRGLDIHPLYDFLSSKERNKRFDTPITSNFHKFLISRDGQIVKVYQPDMKVIEKEVRGDVEALLRGIKPSDREATAKQRK